MTYFRVVKNIVLFHHETEEQYDLSVLQYVPSGIDIEEYSVFLNYSLTAVNEGRHTTLFGSVDSGVSTPFNCLRVLNNTKKAASITSAWREDGGLSWKVIESLVKVVEKYDGEINFSNFTCKDSLGQLHVTVANAGVTANTLYNAIIDIDRAVIKVCVEHGVRYIRANALQGDDKLLHEIVTDVPINTFQLSAANSNDYLKISNRRPRYESNVENIELALLSLFTVYKHPYHKIPGKNRRGVIVEFPSWCKTENETVNVDEIAARFDIDPLTLQEKIKSGSCNLLSHVILRQDSVKYGSYNLLELEMSLNGLDSFYTFFDRQSASIWPDKHIEAHRRNSFDYLFTCLLAQNGMRFNILSASQLQKSS